jgi:hypothetical protein
MTMSRIRRADRKCEFRIVDGVLYRTVEMPDGRSYRHTCALESFADVARFIEEHAEVGVTTTDLWDRLEATPCTQATVALEFLKDRKCVDVERRRCFPTSDCFFEDALCEWRAVAHQCEAEMGS